MQCSMYTIRSKLPSLCGVCNVQTVRGRSALSELEANEYSPSNVERKWQQKWRLSGVNRPNSQGSKFYVLSMFPYPSGRLHMGHVRVYTISDTLAHFQRMNGKKVLHPMGWDAFGLPAENAAIERGIHPHTWTQQNIAMMRGQLDKMGCHFDWNREVTTCSPDYYKWTQWLFLQLFNRGLAYKKKALVNWDPVDKTVLANEQVDENGCSWRSGAKVEQKYLDQWFFKITDYAEALLEGLDDLHWSDSIKKAQEDWIGKSEGAYFDFQLENGDLLRAFTTLPHTVYGVSFLALASQHPLLQAQAVSQPVRDEVERWGKSTQAKNGIFTGLYARHPLTGQQVPVYVADYVLNDYGTQAVMGVPAHDERDFVFASEHSLPVTPVVEDTQLVNSQQFSGRCVEDGQKEIVEYAQSIGSGGHMTTYKLRDWLISRQRYWGAPIPVLYCDKCGVVPDNTLPVLLPRDIKFTGRGPSPLATEPSWTRASCGKPGCCAQRDTDTMDTFVDSSWYFLRFTSAGQTEKPFTQESANHWMPVDIYVGGIEHAVLHLLYARFITHAFHDMGLLHHKEPFSTLIAQGMVQGKTYKEKGTGRYLKPDEDRHAPGIEVTWEKMSKSKYNGVDPEAILSKHGADSVRLFMLFKAPPEISIKWDDQAISGMDRWLRRLWQITHDHIKQTKVTMETNNTILSATHRAIKQVTKAFEVYSFNVAIAELTILTNVLRGHPQCSHTLTYHQALSALVVLLAPMAPHVASELWERMSVARKQYDCEHVEGNVFDQSWPVWREELLDLTESKPVVIQINGKKTAVVELSSSLTDRERVEELKSTILEYVVDKGLLKSHVDKRGSCDLMDNMIVAPTGRLVNIVLKQ